MRAAFLVKYGLAGTAFEVRESEKPSPSPDQVLIKVEAFGLNFADVMARLDLYKAAPPLPAILGYDVVGHIEQCASNISELKVGDRVVALTRFGGYAEYALAEKEMVQKISESFTEGISVALATQYTTAFFLSHTMANLQKGDKVLIHAAAGGVGTALVQMALLKKCTVFGTCSTSEKIKYIKDNGVHYPINYKETNFEKEIRSINKGSGLDVIFDPVGGASVRKGFRLLGAGGRLLTYGVSSMNKNTSLLGKLKVLFQFGIYHPIQFLGGSKGMIGVNMLKVGEERPEKITTAMKAVIQMTEKGDLKPFVGAEYDIEKLAEAHQFLESRKSMGKIVVKW
ncbi:MAG: NADPH:quinone reductase-like Zn-dependent oxidoreductase [Psychroserpens sp.]|jgi:NADPH:quinone reductase-like Zn-dependent oxidoreductase